MTKMVFEYSGYRNVAKINTGLCYEKGFEAKVREFVELYGFEVVEMAGSPELVETCYKIAKNNAFSGKKEVENEKSGEAEWENGSGVYSRKYSRKHITEPENLVKLLFFPLAC
jgi:hypothetical protein